MNQKKIKSIRRAVNKQSDKIKIRALKEFMAYVKQMKFRDRLVFGIQIIFNRVEL